MSQANSCPCLCRVVTPFPVFIADGDFVRGNFVDELGALLDQGVAVALIYGDRDFRCNCAFSPPSYLFATPSGIYTSNRHPGFGGEAISLAIPYGEKAVFAAAGYANISTSPSTVAGVVRQRNRLSFSRVFDAGHEGTP